MWPPVKAWTSNLNIEGHRHFVAINYGGKLAERWVVLMSVIDSNVVLKVSWLQLVDKSKWICGWDENNPSRISYEINKEVNASKYSDIKVSNDSGLTVPITNKFIRESQSLLGDSLLGD